MNYTSDDNILRVSNLTSGYGARTVIRDLSFSVRPQQLCVIEGANGAGKSTLLRCIIGLVPALSGTIMLGGHNLALLQTAKRVRSGLCFVPQGGLILKDLTTLENLEFALCKGGGANCVYEHLYAHPSLVARKSLLAGRLSGGEKQLLSLAMAMALRPSVLMLDEPSIGLSTEALANLLRQLQGLRLSGVSLVVAESHCDWLGSDVDTYVSLERDHALKTELST